MESKTSKKGQAISIDFAIAVSIFIIILLYHTTAWAEYSGGYYSLRARNGFEYSAISISQSLLKTPGIPANWEQNASGASSLGLAYQENVISPEKLANFTALNYNLSRSLLGIPDNYYLEVKRRNDSLLVASAGKNATNKTVSSVQRVALYNNEFVDVLVKVYE